MQVRANAAAPSVTEKKGFTTGEDGKVYVDSVAVDDVRSQVNSSPFYLYSKQQISDNFDSYAQATEGLDAIIGYAIKANNNLKVLEHLQGLGSGAVLVSGNELALAKHAGFNPERTIFNGNGKLPSELKDAVESSCLINVDSEFDLENIAAAAAAVGTKARLLLRI